MLSKNELCASVQQGGVEYITSFKWTETYALDSSREKVVELMLLKRGSSLQFALEALNTSGVVKVDGDGLNLSVNNGMSSHNPPFKRDA